MMKKFFVIFLVVMFALFFQCGKKTVKETVAQTAPAEDIYTLTEQTEVKQIDAEVIKPTQSEDEQQLAPAASETMVWIPKWGVKYHSYSGCSNMKSPSQTSKSRAELLGYGACKKCW